MELGIIGYGRFGRFAASLLKEDFQVSIFDRRRVRPTAGTRTASLGQVARKPVVVLCVPISQIETTCRKIRAYLRSGQLIVDTASVKEQPLEIMKRLLPQSVEILGTHPLFGPDSARAGVEGLRIVLCPVRCKRTQEVKRFLRKLGLKVIVTSPRHHDREMAHTQALFHFLARGVAELGITAGTISTPGPTKLFDDFKDVRHDSVQLFQDLHTLNRFAPAVRKRLIRSLTRIDAALSRRRSQV